jgi:hypothetical protein
VDLAKTAPWLFRFPVGPSLRSLKDGLGALLILDCLARARCVDLIAEARRRGLPCQAKLGVGDILALSLEYKSPFTPRLR